ncbi:MAG TPA: hypothetical protein PK745_12130, partial [bacterium]|nr:hypothetical protein [bacterium]
MKRTPITMTIRPSYSTNMDVNIIIAMIERIIKDGEFLTRCRLGDVNVLSTVIFNSNLPVTDEGSMPNYTRNDITAYFIIFFHRYQGPLGNAIT